jgi:hypothetical protein
MAKAIQCPTCGRKLGVGSLPDAPTFRCPSCGKNLKVPAQFRPSVMASQRHVRRPSPEAQPSSTAVLPKQVPARAARSAPAAARRPAPARPPVRPTTEPGDKPLPLPIRLLAWFAALALGLLITGWIARISGWLSGDRLVDVFTGTGGMERYLRVVALAPAWALVTTLLLTGFLEGGRALARRRNEVRADREASNRRERRSAPRRARPSFDELGRDRTGEDGQRSRRGTQRRAGPSRRPPP